MKKIIYSLIISTGLLIFSCQETTNIGYDILPEEDLLNTKITDTFSLEIHTFNVDSIISSGVFELLLGEYTDPVFGYTKASFVTQFAIKDLINFQDTDIVDSVILTLPYSYNTNNTYGDTTVEQNIEIYRINVDLDNTINYYNNQDPAKYTGELIGDTIGFIPSTKDSLVNIKLYNSLGESFFAADPSNFFSDQSLHNFFKGIYITSESENNNGAIIKYSLNSNMTLTIYFHKNDAEQTATKFTVTAYSSSNARFNLFEHDYSSANFSGTFNDMSAPVDSVAYIQSGGGLKIRINFPYLKNLLNEGNISINRAELIINTIPDETSYEYIYPAINNLFITEFISDTSYILIPDYNLPDGNYIDVDYNGESYNFNIAGYIQDILQGNIENNGINLFSASDRSDISRTIIATGKNSNPTKLVITYTKF